MRRISLAVTISLLSIAAASGQIKSKIPQSADPFSIKSGSSFSASGSGGGYRPAESAAAASRIASDIAYAEELIRQNHVAGALAPELCVGAVAPEVCGQSGTRSALAA